MRHALLLLLISGCATGRADRSYTFRSALIEPTEMWSSTLAATQAHHRVVTADRERSEIVTAPEVFPDNGVPVEVSYAIRLNYSTVWSRRGRYVDGINVDVLPIAVQNGRALSPDELPAAARDHRDELLADIRYQAFRSHAAHWGSER